MPRPTKLTTEVQATIVEAILHGATYRDASESVGVWYTTFNDWMQKGKEAKSGQYHDFYDAVQQANAQCALNFTRVIQSAAAKGDVKAALEWLKRRRREDWGDSVDIEHKGVQKYELVVTYETTNKPPSPAPEAD